MTVYEYIIKHNPEMQWKESENSLVLKGNLDMYQQNFIDAFCTNSKYLHPKSLGEDNYIAHFAGKDLKAIHKPSIIVDDELVFPEDVRRPWIHIRGKRLSEEQMCGIIKDTSTLFEGWDSDDYLKAHDKSCKLNIPVWLSVNGMIAYNDCSWDKYPYMSELLPDWLEVYSKYDFLDMIVAYSKFNENPCYLCPMCDYYQFDWSKRDDDDKQYLLDLQQRISDSEEYACNLEELSECRAKIKNSKYRERVAFEYSYYKEPKDFYKYVNFAIWIHDGKFEILSKERASSVYKEYAEMYEPEDKGLINRRTYWEGTIPARDNEYLIRYFNRMGLDGEKVLDASYKLGILKAEKELDEVEKAVREYVFKVI